MSGRGGRSRRLRWPALAAVVFGALIAAGAGFWLVFVPHWRPPLGEGERYGIDVSAHQDEVDWEQVAGDGIEFAYIKASEGQGWVDDWFEENWTGAARVGLDRGAYHFFTLCAPGEAQARNFLSVAAPIDGALPPAVDLELAGNCSARPPAEDVAAELDAFLELVEQAWDEKALLYVGSEWEARYPVKERLGRPLWQFRFLRRPDVDGWWIWQIHGFARVDGISGGVDLNLMRPQR